MECLNLGMFVEEELKRNIFDLYNWHYATKNIRVTKLMMFNWVGSYYTHQVIQGNREVNREFHYDVCKKIHTFEEHTSLVPFLDGIVSRTLGCTLFSWQPFEILAQSLNISRDEAGAIIWEHRNDSNPLKYIDLIEEVFRDQYGVNEWQFKILTGILGLKNLYRLPKEDDCVAKTEAIVNEYFIFNPTGIVVFGKG